MEDDQDAPLLQYAEWSPDGNAVVFVYDNDIYYKPRVLKPLVCRITSTGKSLTQIYYVFFIILTTLTQNIVLTFYSINYNFNVLIYGFYIFNSFGRIISHVPTCNIDTIRRFYFLKTFLVG